MREGWGACGWTVRPLVSFGMRGSLEAAFWSEAGLFLEPAMQQVAQLRFSCLPCALALQVPIQEPLLPYSDTELNELATKNFMSK